MSRKLKKKVEPREPKQVNFRTAPDVHRLFAQRRQLERRTTAEILERAMVAYVVGDFQVLDEGYRVPAHDPEDEVFVVVDERDGERTEWSLDRFGYSREVGEAHAPSPEELGLDERGDEEWGIEELQRYLKLKLGKSIAYVSLVRCLKLWFGSPVSTGTKGPSWVFTGQHDPVVKELVSKLVEHGHTAGDAAYRRGEL